LDNPQTRALGVVASSTASAWPLMEIVATGNSSGQAHVFADTNIKMKDSPIQVRGFAIAGMLEL
jgi:hypothetical protein